MSRLQRLRRCAARWHQSRLGCRGPSAIGLGEQGPKPCQAKGSCGGQEQQRLECQQEQAQRRGEFDLDPGFDQQGGQQHHRGLQPQQTGSGEGAEGREKQQGSKSILQCWQGWRLSESLGSLPPKGIGKAGTAAAAPLRAVAHLLPDVLPFLAPLERTPTDRADLGGALWVIDHREFGDEATRQSFDQGPLTEVAIWVLPSSESARPRNALTAGSGGFR